MRALPLYIRFNKCLFGSVSQKISLPRARGPFYVTGVFVATLCTNRSRVSECKKFDQGGGC